MDDLDRELEELRRNPYSFPRTPEEFVEDLTLLTLPPFPDPSVHREKIVQYLAEQIERVMAPRVMANPAQAHRITFRLSEELNDFFSHCGVSILSALCVEIGFLIGFANDGTLFVSFHPRTGG